MYTRSTMPFAFALAACAALSLVTLAPAAHAQTFISVNTTLNSSNKVTGDAFVGFDSSFKSYSPTVSLVSGGGVGYSLSVYNSSVVNMSGGSVGINLIAYQSSIVNLSGGSVGGLQVRDSGTLNLFGTGQTATLVTANNGSNYSQYSLSGLLSDGTLLLNKDLYVQNGIGAKFTLNNTAAPAAVPEPGSVALLVGLTSVGAGLLHKRRARK